MDEVVADEQERQVALLGDRIDETVAEVQLGGMARAFSIEPGRGHRRLDHALGKISVAVGGNAREPAEPLEEIMAGEGVPLRPGNWQG